MSVKQQSGQYDLVDGRDQLLQLMPVNDALDAAIAKLQPTLRVVVSGVITFFSSLPWNYSSFCNPLSLLG